MGIAPSTAGIVLAGGKSRRMGADKTQLLLDGASLLDRAFAAIRSYCDPLYAVFGDTPRAVPPDVVVLLDGAPGRGPLQGLATGLASSGAERAVVLSADLPLITRAVVEELLSDHAAAPVEAVVAADGARAHPLVGVYSTALARPASAALARGERGMMAFLSERQVRKTLVSNPLALSNVNTPEEWQAVLRLRSQL